MFQLSIFKPKEKNQNLQSKPRAPAPSLPLLPSVQKNIKSLTEANKENEGCSSHSFLNPQPKI
jgi:hypothetical protein